MPVITRLQALTNALDAFMIDECPFMTEEVVKSLSLYTKQKEFKKACGFHPTKAGQVIACLRWPKVCPHKQALDNAINAHLTSVVGYEVLGEYELKFYIRNLLAYQQAMLPYESWCENKQITAGIEEDKLKFYFLLTGCVPKTAGEVSIGCIESERETHNDALNWFLEQPQ
jgi:hypothetical protein